MESAAEEELGGLLLNGKEKLELRENDRIWDTSIMNQHSFKQITHQQCELRIIQ